MNATFRIDLPNGTSLTEEQLRKNIKAARETIAKLREVEGSIAIENPKTKEATYVGDTLKVVISAFCLKGLKEFQKEGKYQVDFFNHDETVNLVADKNKVIISGTQIVTCSYPAAPYFKAMADCGKRYTEFMKKIG
ncbi:MAG: hypothetical protein JWQ71_1855 [Pedosphaera sp.]|nr:hypothetical protein [Pedosphaera sp.]